MCLGTGRDSRVVARGVKVRTGSGVAEQQTGLPCSLAHLLRAFILALAETTRIGQGSSVQGKETTPKWDTRGTFPKVEIPQTIPLDSQGGLPFFSQSALQLAS
jgi:hypothetical protein